MKKKHVLDEEDTLECTLIDGSIVGGNVQEREKELFVFFLYQICFHSNTDCLGCSECWELNNILPSR